MSLLKKVVALFGLASIYLMSGGACNVIPNIPAPSILPTNLNSIQDIINLITGG